MSEFTPERMVLIMREQGVLLRELADEVFAGRINTVKDSTLINRVADECDYAASRFKAIANINSLKDLK